MTSQTHPPGCGCCCSARLNPGTDSGLTRREFLAGVGAVTVGGVMLASATAHAADAARRLNRRHPERRALVVQPVLAYETPQRREATSWRNWGGIKTDAQATEEQGRIEAELKKLKDEADFPLTLRPVVAVKTNDQAASVVQGDHEVLLVYGAGGS